MNYDMRSWHPILDHLRTKTVTQSGFSLRPYKN